MRADAGRKTGATRALQEPHDRRTNPFTRTNSAKENDSCVWKRETIEWLPMPMIRI